MSMSAEERRTAMRGMRDSMPAVAPLPLPFTLLHHATWIALVAEAERRGRWFYAIAVPALLGLMKLSMDATERLGRARALAAGIDRRADAPRVPLSRTTLWLGVMIPVVWARRLLGRPPRKQTQSEMAAATLGRALVEWWAWRPYLRRGRR
jgi:hypothetical protein